MQRPAPFATVLAASIPLMLVLAGCDPRTSGDAGRAAPETPITADDGRAGTADAPPPPAAAPPGDDDVLSGVPQSIPLPPRDAPTPSLPDATEVVYVCADGSDLRVRYAAGAASVILGAESVVTLALSREASAEHGGEVYTGHGQGLRRIGGVVEFDTGQGEDRIRRCREASSSA